ncbi:hypothetical protein [Sphingomonas pituitosa]|uniref:hypothetical protein n=1 Tax=Sphingomonas pituitosa TaxID=99597 RepID=UPI0012ED90C4|nr:hypothetical protein [Sphingomonas pituitosa]
MDEAHLGHTMRDVSLNPVRAPDDALAPFVDAIVQGTARRSGPKRHAYGSRSIC